MKLIDRQIDMCLYWRNINTCDGSVIMVRWISAWSFELSFDVADAFWSWRSRKIEEKKKKKDE